MFQRFARPIVEAALSDTPVVLVHGPRQAGKSTLVGQIAAQTGRRVVTLDDPGPLDLARDRAAEFLATYEPPVAIDEVQRAPGLFLAMKAKVDRLRSPGSFLLTGSANVLALPKMADSLAGRMEVVDLLPLSQAEIDGAPGRFIDWLFGGSSEPPNASPDGTPLEMRIVRGGYPEPVGRSVTRRGAWFDSYVRTILERDVRDLANIEGMTKLPRLLRSIAGRVGEPINVLALSQETGIADTTLARYVHLLEAVFLLTPIRAWSPAGSVRAAKTSKLYLTDTGLACRVAQIDERSLRDPDRLLPLLRNLVAMELQKLTPASDDRPTLAHLKTLKKLKVDFVLDAGPRGVAGVEVSVAKATTSEDFVGLRFLAELAGPRFACGVVLHRGHSAERFGRALWALPVQSLWQN
jgi:predicted AAA+ superfamily ATPase